MTASHMLTPIEVGFLNILPNLGRTWQKKMVEKRATFGSNLCMQKMEAFNDQNIAMPLEGLQKIQNLIHIICAMEDFDEILELGLDGFKFVFC